LKDEVGRKIFFLKSPKSTSNGKKTSLGIFILFLPFETLVDLGAGDLVPEPLEPGDLAGPMGNLLEDGEAGQARLPLPATHFPADGLQPDWQNLYSN
jgi:hypothetical protein